MMTVKDLFQLSLTKNFSVVAGYNALHKIIISVGILDFEFTEGIQPMREEAFEPHSLVLSSLLFANQKFNKEEISKMTDPQVEYYHWLYFDDSVYDYM